MPQHKNRGNVDTGAQNKSFSTSTQKTCQTRSIQLYQVIFVSHTKYEVKFRPRTTRKIPILIPTLKTSQFRSRAQKPSKFRSHHWNQVNFNPYSNKSIWMPGHKSQLNLDPDTKESHFWPPYKNQVNSDPYTEIKRVSTTHTTTKSTLSLHWNQVRFYLPHWDQVNFDYPHKKPSQFRCSP